jgi:hypothetical protein
MVCAWRMHDKHFQSHQLFVGWNGAPGEHGALLEPLLCFRLLLLVGSSGISSKQWKLPLGLESCRSSFELLVKRQCTTSCC